MDFFWIPLLGGLALVSHLAYNSFKKENIVFLKLAGFRAICIIGFCISCIAYIDIKYQLGREEALENNEWSMPIAMFILIIIGYFLLQDFFPKKK